MWIDLIEILMVRFRQICFNNVLTELLTWISVVQVLWLLLIISLVQARLILSWLADCTACLQVRYYREIAIYLFQHPCRTPWSVGLYNSYNHIFTIDRDTPGYVEVTKPLAFMSFIIVRIPFRIVIYDENFTLCPY